MARLYRVRRALHVSKHDRPARDEGGGSTEQGQAFLCRNLLEQMPATEEKGENPKGVAGGAGCCMI